MTSSNETCAMVTNIYGVWSSHHHSFYWVYIEKITPQKMGDDHPFPGNFPHVLTMAHVSSGPFCQGPTMFNSLTLDGFFSALPTTKTRA